MEMDWESPYSSYEKEDCSGQEVQADRSNEAVPSINNCDLDSSLIHPLSITINEYEMSQPEG
jgi:hypothetical protein